jgi:hypothetical protein
MRLQAQELSVRKGRVVERAPSNFTLSSTNPANGGRPNAIRDEGYSGTGCSAGSATAAFDTLLVDADREDRTRVSARGRSRYRGPSRPLSRSHRERLGALSRVARANDLPTGANEVRKVLSTAVLTKSCAKGNPACSLAARNTSSRSFGSQTL